jgi:TonB family protein
MRTRNPSSFARDGRPRNEECVLLLHRIEETMKARKQQDRLSRESMKLIVSIATFVLLMGPAMAPRLIAQSPRQTAPENQELLKASELSKQVVQLYSENNYKEALEPAKQALEIREKILGKEDQLVGDALSNLGAVYMGLRRYSEAEPCYRRALEINEKTHGPEALVLAPLLDNLGWLNFANGSSARAEQLLNRSLSIREKAAGPNSQEVSASLYSLARFYERTEKYSRSVEYYKRVTELKEKLLGPNSKDVAELFEQCACVMLLNRQNAEAHELETRAYIIRRTLENRPLDAEFFAGDIIQGKATYRLEPSYPAAARQARISGSVVIEVTIDRQGSVLDAKMRCGNQIFAEESIRAARQWRFAPTTKNGTPVIVKGSITFNFKI